MNALSEPLARDTAPDARQRSRRGLTGQSARDRATGRRICVVYDCLFPWTVGGAERWYRALAERLAADGNQVTYLTLTQWDDDAPPTIPGVEVRAVGPRMALYHGTRRRIAPPLRFGLGVLWHLLRHHRRYDHIHCASFPFFPLLAIGALRRSGGYTIGVDWHEVWTRAYWRHYLGVGGDIGWLMQAACARVRHSAFVFSRLHSARLEAVGRVPTLLSGEYAGGPRQRAAAGHPLTLVYAGRLLQHKRVALLIAAHAQLRSAHPDLRLTIIGEGPELAGLKAQVASTHASAAESGVTFTGFVDEAALDAAMRQAAVIVQPSAREGYGMVVVEAAARAVPVVLVESDDNAACELIEAGANGLVAAADPASLALAIAAVLADPAAWRARTAQWYDRHAARLSLGHSLAIVTHQIESRAC